MLTTIFEQVKTIDTKEQVGPFVESNWDDLVQTTPAATDPKKLLVASAEAVWQQSQEEKEMKPEKKKGEKRARAQKEEFDAPALLGRLTPLVIDDDLARTTSRVNGSSDILLTLNRAFVYSQDPTATFGSKATKKTASSLIRKPKAMHHLIANAKMYKLRRLSSPSRTDLALLLNHASDIKTYLESNPDEQLWWQGEGEIQPSSSWWTGQ